MSLEKIISTKFRWIFGVGLALSMNAQADLPKLYNALAAKGIVATPNEKMNIKSNSITADIYIDEFSSSIRYPLVVIDETKNSTEKTAVESIGGKYIVCSDDASKVDSIIRLISSRVSTINSAYRKKTETAKNYSGTYNLMGRKTAAISKNKLYINKNSKINSYFSKRLY